MKKSNSLDWQGCPVRYSAGLIGDKWSLLLIRDLMFKDRRHFGDFLDDDETIATNILTDRLNRLVSSGIVDKSRDVNDGKRFVYKLTHKGRDLLPVMVEMFKWAQKYDEHTFVSQEFIDELSRAPKRYKNKVLKGIEEADEKALRIKA